MINNSRELSDLLGRVFPCDENMSTKDKQMAKRACNSFKRYVFSGLTYPITEKRALGKVDDGFAIEKYRNVGRKTAEYIVTKVREYLDSLTLEERMAIDEEDESFENSKRSGAFKAGDVVLYKRINDEHYELGIVKRPCDDGSGDCYVWYHQGNTASRTPYSCLRRISNLYAFAIRRIRVDEEMTMPA